MTNHTDTSRSGDLVERLRDLAAKFEGQGGKHYTAALFGECVDRIEALEAEVGRLRGKVSQAILYFDDIAGLTENPLYDPLEVGFRHSPLSPKEREERYATACSAAWQSAQHGLAALGEKQ